MYSYILLSIGLILAVFIVWAMKGIGVKRVFSVPWYVLYIGSDIGGRKALNIKKSILVGAPDALFFDWTHLRYIVGEFKSRKSTYTPTERETNQCLLYMGMINKFYHINPTGVLAYGNGINHIVKFDKKRYKKIYKRRFELLKVINKF